MFQVVFAKQATKDARKLKAAGLDAKTKALIDIIREDPFRVPPSYEALVGNLAGLYSRRINLQHRFVYEVIADPVEDEGIRFEGTVKVLSMWSHYEALR